MSLPFLQPPPPVYTSTSLHPTHTSPLSSPQSQRPIAINNHTHSAGVSRLTFERKSLSSGKPPYHFSSSSPSNTYSGGSPLSNHLHHVYSPIPIIEKCPLGGSRTACLMKTVRQNQEREPSQERKRSRSHAHSPDVDRYVTRFYANFMQDCH